LDTALGARAYEAALSLGHPPERARALASAVTILDAVEAKARMPEPPATAAAPDTTDLLQEIGPVSRALRRPDEIAAVRARAAADPAESVAAHE
ncbi:hypothetical protein GT030_18170, partial [Streptomyces sp. SID1328]|nr:hypothetical protein [Streptomyces sp. SID1328]